MDVGDKCVQTNIVNIALAKEHRGKYETIRDMENRRKYVRQNQQIASPHTSHVLYAHSPSTWMVRAGVSGFQLSSAMYQVQGQP